MYAILRRTALALLAGLAFSLAPHAASAASRAELKAQFKARYPALSALKDAGKVGENPEGRVEVVKAKYADDRARDGQMVKQLLAAENRDRSALYALVAKDTGASADEVARQAALRHFREAKPDHYVKLRSGRWVKKKDVSGAG